MTDKIIDRGWYFITVKIVDNKVIQLYTRKSDGKTLCSERHKDN